MLFNSYQFILGFLPLAVVAFYFFGRYSRSAALRWLILASLVFYAWWRPVNVAIILPSIIINYFLARRLLKLGQDEANARAAQITLIVGVIFNICFLGYFKYTNFVTGAMNDTFGTEFVLTNIILPLGISFITFQKIAFLIDVHGGRVKSFNFEDYALFVLFFPQLIAGPIVHYREMMPQFQSTSCRFNGNDVAVGMTLFAFGLFKKAVLADGIAPSVTSLYERVAAGDTISMIPAVMAAVGFTLQIYFDFSGYSDMAIGIGRMFGIRLPANFDSPLRAPSIIDYWLRWHITLSRFLTAYIYNPVLLRMTRRRMSKGLPALGARTATVGAFVMLLAFPTLVTMAISGLWHGAGYTFIFWGVLHGIFLSVNHGWRLLRQKYKLFPGKGNAITRFVSIAVTFTAVCVAMVFFKAPTMTSAWSIVGSIVGLNGIGLPASLFDIGPIGSLLALTGGGPEAWWSAQDMAWLLMWLVGLFIIAMFLPNTGQMLAKYEPALGLRPAPTTGGRLATLAWSPTLGWAVALAVLTFAAVIRIGGPSEFLYWQF